jgi:hypothetical protein
MNLYKAYFNGKSIEVYADTQYAAQLLAASIFRVKKSWKVHTALLALDGVPYVHTATN